MYTEVEEEVILDNFYVVDIFVPKQKMIIEVNGLSHYTHHGKPIMKTVVKQKLLKKLGYSYFGINAMQVLRLRNHFKDPERALSAIKNQMSFMQKHWLISQQQMSSSNLQQQQQGKQQWLTCNKRGSGLCHTLFFYTNKIKFIYYYYFI